MRSVVDSRLESRIAARDGMALKANAARSAAFGFTMYSAVGARLARLERE